VALASMSEEENQFRCDLGPAVIFTS
jgi:hypothetical protein